jgi:hypothetical protein
LIPFFDFKNEMSLKSFVYFICLYLNQSAACGFASAVGERMVAKDAYVPFALFADFALPKVAALCKSQVC